MFRRCWLQRGTRRDAIRHGGFNLGHGFPMLRTVVHFSGNNDPRFTATGGVAVRGDSKLGSVRATWLWVHVR